MRRTFYRVGAWEDSAATNLRSADAARKGGEPNEAYHASDYAVYAYLQLARDGDARRTMEEVSKVTDFNPAIRTAPYAIAAMPARYAIERGAWHEAMQLIQPNEACLYRAPSRISRERWARGAAATLRRPKSMRRLAVAQSVAGREDNYWSTKSKCAARHREERLLPSKR